MKKALMFLVSLVMCIVVLPANAIEFENWELDYFVDDFGDPTEKWYIYNNVPALTQGVSNNMTGIARIVVGEYIVGFELYEDVDIISGIGTKVVNTTANDKTYRVSIKDGKGQKYSYTGTLSSGGDFVYVANAKFYGFTQADIDKSVKNQKIYETLCDIFTIGGEIKFVITPDNNPNQKYSFTVDPTDTFLKAFPLVGGHSFTEGMAMVKKVKCGYIDTTGKLAIPYEWDDAKVFSEGLAAVKQDDKWGFINQSGELVIRCEWKFAGSFSGGLAAVEKNGKWGFIDTTGKVVVSYNWDSVGSFSEGLADVKKNNKWGYIDEKGNLVIPCEWDDAFSFTDGLARVGKGEKEYFIDKNGNVHISSTWDSIRLFSEGMCAVEKNDKYGFIDTTGRLVIPCEWDAFSEFKGGLAPVRKNDEWWLIDKSGKLICSLGAWNYVSSFSEGLATVTVNGRQGCIDTNGNLVIPCQWEYIAPFSENLAFVDSTQDCFITRDGRVLFP